MTEPARLTAAPALCCTEIAVSLENCADGRQRPMLHINSPVGVIMVLMESEGATSTGQALLAAGASSRSGLIMPNGHVPTVIPDGA